MSLAEAEDVLIALVRTISGLSALPVREQVLGAADGLPAITVEREKTEYAGGYEAPHIRVGIWATTGAATRELAALLPEEFQDPLSGLGFRRVNRESGLGMPKPSREEHACFTAVVYRAEN